MNGNGLLTPTPHAVAPRRRWRWLGLFALLIMAVIAVVAVWRPPESGAGLAGEAAVTASSTRPGTSARNIVTSGSASASGGVWRSNHETLGAWVELSWAQAHNLRRLTVVRNSLEERGVTSGVLSFEDGSSLQFDLSRTSPTTQVSFTPRMAGRVRMTVTGVEPGTREVAIADILVETRPSRQDVIVDQAPDGNAALSAFATQSAGSQASDPRSLQDGTGDPGPAGTGAVWSVAHPLKSWVQLEWDEPRELTSVAVVGGADSPATLSEATLTFGDGAQLPIGAVLADPNRPTILSFMPRATKSIRLTMEGTAGSGTVALSELRTYQRGSVPVRTVGSSSDPIRPASASCGASTSGSVTPDVAVRCPQTGSMVTGDSADLHISVGPGYSSILASVWAADATGVTGPTVRAVPNGSGLATLTMDVSALPSGPFTVQIQAKGTTRQTKTIFFQLYRGGADGRAPDVPSSKAGHGRSLVFAEEFNQPVSITRTGHGADYSAAKPTHSGAEDFGDAIFADPVQGSDTIGVVDSRYLRVTVQPAPADLADPQGRGRTRLGGLLSSGRPGGSGFSAQYGYFEARLLAPAAPGTWPAFWMLPSDNLIKPQPIVAEIDAVELYGHDATGACHSTHEYRSGTDGGGVARCGRRYSAEREALSWHTYGVSVTPTGITFFIDGRVVATAPQVEGGGAPMFFLVNLALGGGWPVDLQAVQERAVLYVDYVRVYV